MYFKRKIYAKLKEWKHRSNGSTAMLIEGARRVGKSTVVQAFAEAEYKSYVLIDFSTCSREIRALFEENMDLDYTFLQLQLQYGVKLIERKSVLVFDEVQFCPRARQRIKALVADGRYDYIETGSLISIQRNVRDILIPSEEEHLEMFPMDFEEFLDAIGEGATNGLLYDVFQKRLPLGAAHRRLLRLFRLYMLVGGMPQAVEAYRKENNFEDVDRVKRAILQLYEDDFRKLDPSGKISALFNSIPAQLLSASRFIVSHAVPNLRPSRAQSILPEMLDSKTVLRCTDVADPGPGMAASIDLRKFKLYLADTGLFTTLAFKDRSFTENDLYRKLLSDKLPANLGHLYENAVAQTLAAKGDRLCFHTFEVKGKTTRYEVDFLLTRKSKLVPLEVKSTSRLSHASLDAFQKKYSQHVSESYVVCTKDYARKDGVTYLPIYMLQFL